MIQIWVLIPFVKLRKWSLLCDHFVNLLKPRPYKDSTIYTSFNQSMNGRPVECDFIGSQNFIVPVNASTPVLWKDLKWAIGKLSDGWIFVWPRLKQIHKMVTKQWSFSQPNSGLKKVKWVSKFYRKIRPTYNNSLQFIKQRNWILSNFPKDTRYETVLISSSSSDNSIGNVLTAQTMQYVRKNDNRAILTVSWKTF